MDCLLLSVLPFDEFVVIQEIARLRINTREDYKPHVIYDSSYGGNAETKASVVSVYFQ
jgi:hypothetical protein